MTGVHRGWVGRLARGMGLGRWGAGGCEALEASVAGGQVIMVWGRRPGRAVPNRARVTHCPPPTPPHLSTRSHLAHPRTHTPPPTPHHPNHPAGGRGAEPTMRLARPTSVKPGGGGSQPWVLQEREFEEGVVGGKSRNLAALKAKLPDW